MDALYAADARCLRRAIGRLEREPGRLHQIESEVI